MLSSLRLKANNNGGKGAQYCSFCCTEMGGESLSIFSG